MLHSGATSANLSLQRSRLTTITASKINGYRAMSPTKPAPNSMLPFRALLGIEITTPTSVSDASSTASAVMPPAADTPPDTDGRVKLANVAVGQLVRGRYRVARMWHIVRSGAASFWVVQLVDRTGSLRAYGWPDKVAIPAPLSEGTLVDVEFAIKLVHGPQGKLYRFDAATNVTALDLIATLPPYSCPIPGVIDGVHEVVRNLRTPALRHFLALVFNDYDLCRRYFQVPASFGDHHSEQGGMARHCLEGARVLASITGMEDWMRELAIVCFLVHDIGKTWTNSKLPLHFECYHLVEHDDLSLEILAGALKQLDVEWPHGGLAIRHCLTCASQGSRYGKKAAMPIADLVHSVDRLSQLIDLVARFCDPAGEIKKLKDGRRLWQPAKPANSPGTDVL